MSYLANPSSTIDYGVTKIGNNIQVSDGIISILQDVAPNANVMFNSINVNGNLASGGNLVVTSVSPKAGAGITVSNVVPGGTAASFTVTNTGVTNLVAGTGIALSGNTGNITATNTGVVTLSAGTGITLSNSTGNVTISGTGTSVINVAGTTGNYTATDADEYIGIDSVSAVTISLPVGIAGRTYIIKDEHGQGSGKITVKPVTGELIDGAAIYIISVPFQAIQVVFRAGQWRLI